MPSLTCIDPMVIPVKKYTGKAVMVSVRFGLDVARLITGVSALLIQDACAKIEILPGKVTAIMLLTEGDDEGGACAGYHHLMAPFAGKGENGPDVATDIIDWPKK